MTFFDNMGDRLKDLEHSYTLSRAMKGIPLIARLDGRAFHTFTRGLEKPYDARMSAAMIETTKFLVEETHALTGYTQSDEITLAWYVPADSTSDYLFNGKTQKLISTLSALATVKFFEIISKTIPEKANLLPTFDCRVFQTPTLVEGANAFLWRELDARKNSISMAAHAYFPHKQLEGKDGGQKQDMLFTEFGINWNDYPPFFKRGVYVQRKTTERLLTPEELARIPEKHRFAADQVVKRSSVVEIDMPPATKVINLVGVIFNKENPITQEIKSGS